MGRKYSNQTIPKPNGSARLSVGNRGGMLIPNVSAEKLFIIMSVQSAVAALPLTEIATGNTVVTPVMFRLGSREVCPVTREQFNNEIMYQASIAPFRKMVNKGIISVEEYTIICTILSQKYQPIFVGNIVSI
ncbi:MAG: SHOCT domain-containing protein [Ruminococcus sp.]|nr:SHOCT domain-containing protein [Ruminococcus sp.]